MAGHKLVVTPALVLCLLATALVAAPPRPRRVKVLPPEPSALVDDVLTISPRSTPLYISEHRISFTGHAFPVKNSDARAFLIRLHQHIDATDDEYWTTRYPPCKVGMLLPVCGHVGRVQAVDDSISLRFLYNADIPAGLKPPGDGFPLILGITDGPAHRRLRIDRIGTDDSNALSVDLTTTWTLAGEKELNTHRETFRQLTSGDVFPVHEIDSQSDYRIEQIIPADEKHQVVGWITLRPVLGSIRWREHAVDPRVPPRTIVVKQAVRRGKGRPPLEPLLPTFHGTTNFRGKSLTLREWLEPSIEIHIVARVGEQKEQSWSYWSPDCAVGMLLPLCGKVGRVRSARKDVEFRMLDETEVPEGVEAPGDNCPIILGGHCGGFGDLRLERIGIDDSGTLSADIERLSWAPADGSSHWKRETIKLLKVGSTFTQRTDRQVSDYRVMQIVAPNDELQVPGWITVWPIEDQ